MNIDDDYDNDGNNIVPCPICLDVYCPSKEDGKCPQEDEFAKHYLNTPYTEWETQDAILQVFKDKYPLPSIGYDGSEQDFKERKIQYCLVKELIYRAVVYGKKSLKHLLTSRDTYWQNHEQDMYESLEKANREQTILDVARVRDERDTYWKERVIDERKKWQTWVSHDVTCYLYTEEGDSKDCTCGLYHAFTNEDNLK